MSNAAYLPLLIKKNSNLFNETMEKPHILSNMFPPKAKYLQSIQLRKFVLYVKKQFYLLWFFILSLLCL